MRKDEIKRYSKLGSVLISAIFVTIVVMKIMEVGSSVSGLKIFIVPYYFIVAFVFSYLTIWSFLSIVSNYGAGVSRFIEGGIFTMLSVPIFFVCMLIVCAVSYSYIVTRDAGSEHASQGRLWEIYRSEWAKHDPYVKLALTRNASAPTELLADIAGNVNGNDSKNLTTVRALLDGDLRSLKVRIVMNGNAPMFLYDRWKNDKSFHVKRAISKNTRTPINVLEYLANDGDLFIRVAVATNKNTSAEILSNLLKDKESAVRRAAALNIEASE